MRDPNDDTTNTIPRGATSPSRVTLRERQRMRRVTSLRPYAAAFCLVVAFGMIGKELERYWFHDKPIAGIVIAISAVIGFLGAYMLNHDDTKDAASFVVNQGITIIGAIRGGRRATDPVVVAPAPDPVVREDRSATRRELPPTLPESEQ